MPRPDYVLLVDNDEMVNYINKNILEKVNAESEIFVAENGEEAFALIHEIEAKAGSSEKILCILLDLDMPLLNGYEFLDELAKARTDLKIQVNVLSTLLEGREQKNLKPFPVAKCIEKPLDKKTAEEILFSNETVYFNQLWESSEQNRSF